MADVVANLEFNFSVTDAASPVATKAAANMDAVAAVMADSAASIQGSAEDVAAGLAESAKSITTAVDPMDDYVEGMNKIIEKDVDFSESFKTAATAIEASTKAVDDNRKSLLDNLAQTGLLVGTWTGIGKAASGAGKGFVSLFNVFKDSKFVQSFGAGISKAFDTVKAPRLFQAIGKDVALVGSTLGKGVSTLATGVTGGVTKAVGLLSTGLKSALGFLTPILDLVTSVFGPAMEQLSDTMSAVLEPIQGALLQVMQRLLPGILAAIAPLQGFVLMFITKVADVLLREDSPFLKIFQTIFGLFTRLQPIFDKLMDGVGKYANTIMPAIEKLLSTLIDALGPILTTVIDAIVQIYDAIGPLVTELLGSLEPILKEIGDVIGVLLKELIPVLMPLIRAAIAVIRPLLPIVVTLIKLLAEILVPLIKLLAPMLTWVAKFIEVIAVKFGGLLQSLAKQMELGLDIFKEWIQPIVKWIDETWTAFFGNFDQNIADMGKWFEGLGKTIKGWADDVGKWFTDLFANIGKGWEELSKTVAFIWENLGTLVSTGFKAILNSTLIDPVNAMLKTIKDITIPGTEIKPFGAIPTLEKFAKGGIVTGYEGRGGLPALIGEAGPEAIIPLNRETLQQLAPAVNVTVAGGDESAGLLAALLETQRRTSELIEEFILSKRTAPVGGR